MKARSSGLARRGCAVVLAALLVASCAGSKRANTITLKGSDTMVLLGQRWAERYMAEHPGVTVQVTGGGSGTYEYFKEHVLEKQLREVGYFPVRWA